MKQKYAVLVFLVLIAASATTSFSSYRATERLVQEDMSQALALCTLAMLWGMFCLYQHSRQMIQGLYGGLALLDGNIVDANGSVVKLTPMQQQLMEMFFRSPNHTLSKTEICDALWPKKDDASETLYTLIRRLKPIIEAHSDLKIEADRGKAYELKIK